LIAPVIQRLAWVACQYPADAERFAALGVAESCLTVSGSVKFDLEELIESDAQRSDLQKLTLGAGLADRPCWIGGSTHNGEEHLLLAAHRELLAEIPDLCLVLVPRHPERFEEVAKQAEGFRLLCASELLTAEAAPAQARPQVLLIDCMGLLRSLYALSRVAFVGGSLVSAGGHNPIEAAVAGVPMLMGPHRFNFVGVCAEFTAEECLHEVTDVQSIQDAVLALLQDDARHSEESARAQAVVERNRGTTARIFAGLTHHLSAHQPGSWQSSSTQ
jgi:3-deoxy-D-manno-octulosonic-acid transferase